MKRALLIGICMAFLVLLVSGCTQNYTPNHSSNATIVPSTIGALDNVIDANNQFGTELYSVYKSKEGNLFFSPYSISSALTMTYEGARGQTAEEMQNVLHLPGNIDKVRSGFATIYSGLNRADKPYSLNTANALWAQKDYPFDSGYLSTIANYYGGNATNLDFRKDAEGARRIINSWVEDKTNGKIKDIISQGQLDATTRMVLTNTIYFKANWTQQFDSDLTRDQPFTTDSGNVTVKMMHQTEYFNYSETSNFQMLEMPYKGNDLSMIIILPKYSLSSMENSLSTDNLASWKASMKEQEVVVSISKFKFETKYLMASDLAAMGMPTAFSWPGADFTGMSPTGELYIGQVIHQTFVEVSESGTEAAAATAVVMKAGAAPGVKPPEPKVFTADHPFIFLIQEKATGNILFMGRIANPLQA
jgi:serpin B